MVFKNFRLNIAIRVAALTISIALEMAILFNSSYYISASVLAFIIIAQAVLLVRFVEKSNGLIARFFQQARHGDFPSASSLRGHGRSFDELYAAFAGMMDEYRKARAQTEEHYQSLQTVIQHIGFGLISFRKDGEVGLMNSAAKRLLRVHQLANIRSLAGLDEKLVRTLFGLASGDKALVKVERDGDPLQLAVYATEYRLGEHQFTLVSLQDIGTELDEKEMEAWQNLIRVLTHEIMNSITPISSLASTVNDMLHTAPADGLATPSPEYMEDIRQAVGTIEKRSQGLLRFVDAYRNLTHIPRPLFRQCLLIEIFSRVHTLLQSQIHDSCVEWASIIEPESLELSVDPDLLEQVLINLVRNALQSMASQETRKLTLLARSDNTGHVLIDVSDNGPGVPRDMLQRIFIPFFTTKEEGSGIGLSLSRQIMRLHGGTITCRSVEGGGTTFTLRF